jgi:hypothetical protein
VPGTFKALGWEESTMKSKQALGISIVLVLLVAAVLF